MQDNRCYDPPEEFSTATASGHHVCFPKDSVQRKRRADENIKCRGLHREKRNTGAMPTQDCSINNPQQIKGRPTPLAMGNMDAMEVVLTTTRFTSKETSAFKGDEGLAQSITKWTTCLERAYNSPQFTGALVLPSLCSRTHNRPTLKAAEPTDKEQSPQFSGDSPTRKPS